ncbi:eukaryotic aspartyl protease family protein [Apiospora kogelbergensis]|uniref:Eukaryotic aspartyl protease family protein n=1 Tax=Apiospora kogelbergensis TaxID=1337665 RepID=A0AAW0QQ27_9PEZI
MCSTRYAPSLLGAFIVFATGTLGSADLEPLWLEPSQKWHVYGIDGNWSAIGLLVGEPAQQVDVTVNTALSELWVVESSGCDSTNVCKTARGNVFDIGASKSWGPMGQYQLGPHNLAGNGDYAMETVMVYDSVRKLQTPLQKQIVAGINDTQYFTGFLGLGITPGKFQDAVVLSPLANMVEQLGVVPSHSYGYTAGAYYAGADPVTNDVEQGENRGRLYPSLWGGYDENRFVPHATNFNLNIDRQTEVLVRGISAQVTNLDKAPTKWSSTSRTLLGFNESVKAVIDTTTPYLWLPTPVCEHFAQALGLKWNETFGLYMYTNDNTFDSFQRPDLSFTFTLSSSDNLDNFGQPLDVPGAVNITISANAFAQTLRFPFQNLFSYGDPAVPYFPLKRNDNASQAIIGRSFMQEVYMITNYESSTFSLHKALFPENPRHNTSIVTTKSDSTSPYPGPAAQSADQKEGLGIPQIVGIVVGAFLFGIASLIAIFCLRRRKRNQMRNSVSEVDDWKGSDIASEPDPPQTPVRRIFSRITKKFSGKKSKKIDVHEVPASTARAVEVGADINHERYELAVPPEPAELDASDAHSINDTTDFGSEDTQNLGAYEAARRKMERQLQGPVPEYSPPASGFPMEEGGEKGHQDISHVAHYRPSDHPSTDQSSSPTSSNNSTYPLPSPLTPRGGDWTGRMPDPPSPILYMSQNSWPHSNPSIPYSLPSPNTIDHRSLGRSDSSGGDSPTSSTGLSLQPPPPATQRAPIDTSRIVCLGPLPNNVRLPHQRPAPPRLVGPDGHAFVMPTIPSASESRRGSNADTLGSNFTVEEDEQGDIRVPDEEASPTSSFRLDGPDEFVHIPQPPPRTEDFANRLDPRADLVHIPTPPGAPSPTTGCLDGVDVVHIPQPASRRYSWEEQ